jgi:hypothetical protein
MCRSVAESGTIVSSSQKIPAGDGAVHADLDRGWLILVMEF